MSEKAKKTLRVVLMSVLSLIVAVDTFFIIFLVDCMRGIMNKPVVPEYVLDIQRRVSVLENNAASSVKPTSGLAEDAESNESYDC